MLLLPWQVAGQHFHWHMIIGTERVAIDTCTTLYLISLDCRLVHYNDGETITAD